MALTRGRSKLTRESRVDVESEKEKCTENVHVFSISAQGLWQFTPFTRDAPVFGSGMGPENKDIMLQVWRKPLELFKIVALAEQAPAFALEVNFSLLIFKWQ